MPETVSNKKVFSLLEVTQSIQRTLAERYGSPFWVTAEMNKLNHYSHSGHCYPDLVEKRDGKVIAQFKSNLWKNDFQRINARFLSVLKEPLKDGIKILFSAMIQFDPSHGLSLRILDIDPAFSLGELEREKQATIERLNSEGIFAANKKLKLPLLPQRIAVISVETSKGYADYLKIIEHNPWGYKFFHLLFPSLLQGERSIASIIQQLDRIRKVVKYFDAVAIIRGGGGEVGLSSFNHYDLAREIARFPIPVITGIGHATNETVAEMVAFKNAITPTALADFLIQKFHDFSGPVIKAEELIANRSKRILKEEQLRLQNIIRFFQSVTKNRLHRSYRDIESASQKLSQHATFRTHRENHALLAIAQRLKRYPRLVLQNAGEQLSDIGAELKKNIAGFVDKEKYNLQILEKNVHILDPKNILNRGFTITLNRGKAVKSFSDLQHGDVITTVLAEGEAVSEVKSVKKTIDL
jgi:exodeoxyribonuclease VII large subunit